MKNDKEKSFNIFHKSQMKVLFDNTQKKFKQKLERDKRNDLGVVCYTAGGNNITLGM